MLLTKLANQEVVNFLRTVTIKNGYFADQLLQVLVRPQYRDGLPIERNPYYMHLTGQYILRDEVNATLTDPQTGVKYTQTYGTSFYITNEDGVRVRVTNKQVYTDDAFDEMMYITSLDTQEEIPFTRENLHGDAANAASTVHKKTLEAYKVPGRYFNMLCKKYPKQVDLIKSIVYLVDPIKLSSEEIAAYGSDLPTKNELRMRNAIEAEHLSLLQYDDQILEDRERYDILDTVRATLNILRLRWDVKEYTFEENYANVHWAMMWSLLPLAIVAQRYANIRSPQVHSSHVWDYLTSKGLDSYRGYLTPAQEFFLYKNFQFLKDNSGQHRVLNILIDNLLTEYNLHIESKTVVMDKTGITNETDIGTNYSEQCAHCSRRSICFKNITKYACDEFVGISETLKPRPIILSEDLTGVRKSKVLDLLKTRYDCEGEEAEKRYDRSFMWHDAAIDGITAELDREQTIDTTGAVEELEDVILREYESKLEPVFNDDVVESQRLDLRHVRSSYLPTKLLEIIEDPVEPTYDEMFTRFVTDTFLHLAPQIVNGSLSPKVAESYSMMIGQDAISFIFSYGEMLAAMYLGFIREQSPDIVVDYPDAEGKYTQRSFISNFKEYKSFEFKIPSTAILNTTFRLGKPVKQQDLVDAWNNVDESLNELGNYVTTEDVEPQYFKKYYIISGGGYVLAGNNGFVSAWEEGVEYFEFKTLKDLAANKDDNTELVTINGEIYAVSCREKGSSDEDIVKWEGFANVYTVLGKYTYKNNAYIYYENNGEIAVIPKYFRWHSDHLGVPSYRTYDEMVIGNPNPKVGDVAVVWGVNDDQATTGVDERIYIYALDNVGSTYSWRNVLATDKCEVIQVPFEQTYNEAAGDYSTKVMQTTIHAQNDVLSFTDITFLTPEEREVTTDELTEYKNFVAFADSAKAEKYDLCELEHYVNVDWILDNLYIEMLGQIDSQSELGEYIEKMFTILERLDMIRASAGDIRTKLAITEFLKTVLVDQSKKEFKLVNIGDNASPTYEDWFQYNQEIGNSIRKIDSAINSQELWNEFSLKLYGSLLNGCGLAYANISTDKTKYNKLKALIKSLSSYLINFTDGNAISRVSTELPHIAEDTHDHKTSFRSFVDLSIVKETTERPKAGDVTGDEYGRLFIPVREKFAVDDDVIYFHRRFHTDMDSNGQIIPYTDDEFGGSGVEFVRDGTIVKGSSLVKHPYYFFINVKDLVGATEDQLVRVIRLDNDASKSYNWYYQIGNKVKTTKTVPTYPADPEAIAKETSVYENVAKITATSGIVDSTVYFKEIEVDDIEWSDPDFSNSATIAVLEKLSAYLNLYTRKWALTCQSEMTLQEIGYLLTEDENGNLVRDSFQKDHVYETQL